LRKQKKKKKKKNIDEVEFNNIVNR